MKRPPFRIAIAGVGAAATALAWQIPAPAGSAPRTALAELEGRYSRAHRLPMLDGSDTAYQAEDALEIVRASRRRARLRLTTQFPNGHSCTFEGTGRLSGGILTVREARRGVDGRLCRLAVRRQGGWILWTDGGGSCVSYCGMRGSLNGRLPYGSRIPLL